MTRSRFGPALAVRSAVTLVAVAALVLVVAAVLSGGADLGSRSGTVALALIGVGALTRRWGVALPGNGFASYVLGVVAYAVFDRGWAFATLVAPFTMVVGDVFFRRLSIRAALDNAAHLTAGTAATGLLYHAIGGVTGTPALSATNLFPLAAFLLLLPLVVNGTFYLSLALSRAMAWVDARLTLRWEVIVYVFSAALALGWLRTMHADLTPVHRGAVALVLLGLTLGSLYVVRVGVRADELQLVQRLAQAIAAETSLGRSFPRVQELTRRLVPWEQMGFARYHPQRREMHLVADTAVTGTPDFRFDADAGLTAEALRGRRPLVAHHLQPDQVVLPGGELPGAEILVPLYRADELVGLWSVRHSDPTMYRDSDAAVLNLLAPQLALLLALEASVQPVVRAAHQTRQYVQTLGGTTQRIHASSQEVAAAARRASDGTTQTKGLVEAAAREVTQLERGSGEVAAAGDETRTSGEQMEATARRVRHATDAAVRQLTELGTTAEESAAEVRRLRDVAERVEQFSETIGFVANQTNLLALNATIESARAGVHGRGFAVVADEVHKLAEQSGREARNVGKSVQDTRRALDRAAELLERIRTDLDAMVQSSADWVADLERITEAAAATARAGKRVADVARANAELAARVARSLTEGQVGAQASTEEAGKVAAAAADQLKAIEELSHGSLELVALVEDLARAVRFVEG